MLQCQGHNCVLRAQCQIFSSLPHDRNSSLKWMCKLMEKEASISINLISLIFLIPFTSPLGKDVHS